LYCSADEASTADEDADNVDEELSDDWSVTRASGWTTSQSARRSNRRRQRSTRMNNFGNRATLMSYVTDTISLHHCQVRANGYGKIHEGSDRLTGKA